jgi:hypothetical protein
MTGPKIGRTVGALLIIPLLVAVATFALTAGTPPLYEARARLEAAPVPLLREFDAAVSGRTAASVEADQRLQRDDLGDAALAARDARVRYGATSDVTFTLDIDAEHREFDVVALTRNPQASAQLADAFAEALIARRNARLDQRISDVQALLLILRAVAPNHPAARQRMLDATVELTRLRGLSRFSGGGVFMVRRAEIPRERIAPHALRNVIAATVLGLLVVFTPKIAGETWGTFLGRIRYRKRTAFRLPAS